MEGKTTMPLLSLASAAITLTASYDHEFDGLAIILQALASSTSKWIKLGVESLGGQPRLSM
jgi:hypothetical protein